jgi:Predicted aminoglycoside phosphotransferase
MKKGKMIGKGMTAEVYEWGRDKVLKLYFERYGDERIYYDTEIGHIVHEAGVVSPAIFDIIELDGRKGVILERVHGNSLTKKIEFEPWKLDHYIKKFARAQYGIHKCSAEGLPTQRERFEYKINRSYELLGDKVKRIMEYVESLPDGNNICHGDYHLSNIIVTSNGLVPIDWAGAYKGSPLGDVARTCLMIGSPPMFYKESDITMLTQIPRYMKFRSYIYEYMKCAKVKWEDIDAWILPVAAAKLKDKISVEKRWLMNIIDKRLDSLKKMKSLGRFS